MWLDQDLLKQAGLVLFYFNDKRALGSQNIEKMNYNGIFSKIGVMELICLQKICIDVFFVYFL